MRCHRHSVEMVASSRTDARGGHYRPRHVHRCQRCVAEAKAGVRYQRAHNWRNLTRRGLLQLNGEALWARHEVWLSLKQV